MNILTAFVRSVIAFVLLLVVTRIVGRKIFSRMTFFEYSVAITMGSLAARFCVGQEATPLIGGIAILTLGFLAVIASLISLKGFRSRKLLESEPVVVIQKGELVKANMKKIRVTLDMLTSLLWEKDIFNIADVEYALIERDGMISVLLKANKQPLTPADMGLAPPYRGLTTELIIDGMLMRENLRKTNHDESWLMEQLALKGIRRIEDVFFAALDSSESLYVSLGISGAEEHGQYGIE